MSVYIKGMEMPVDCMACRIGCIHATSLVVGRPEDCPLEEAKDGDLISRADAIEAICNKCGGCDDNHDECWEITALKALPSAEATGALDDAIAKYVADGLMELPSAEAVQGEWIGYNADKEDWLRTDGAPIFLVCDKCHGTVINNGSAHWNFCPNCGARMTPYKGGEDDNA